MPDVLTLDASYLNKKRIEVKNDVAYARYKVGGNWYRSEIENAQILSDGRIEITFIIDHTVSGNITVTGIELYNHNGERIASKTVSIQRASAQEGVLYVCRFRVFQVVKNDKRTGEYDAI